MAKANLKVSPEIRDRAKMAALKRGCTIEKYVSTAIEKELKADNE